MSFQQKNDDDEIMSQINIIPLVDVSLVLLIIVLVTANHLVTPSLRIKLPEATNANSVSNVDGINITITNEGIIYLDNDIVTLKELTQKVEKLHNANPNKGLVLNVDKSTYFQRVVSVFDALGKLNLSKLDIRTIKD